MLLFFPRFSVVLAFCQKNLWYSNFKHFKEGTYSYSDSIFRFVVLGPTLFFVVGYWLVTEKRNLTSDPRVFTHVLKKLGRRIASICPCIEMSLFHYTLILQMSKEVSSWICSSQVHFDGLCTDARVVKGVDLRSSGFRTAWVRAPLRAGT